MAVSVFAARTGFGDALFRRPVGPPEALVIVFTSTRNHLDGETPVTSQPAPRTPVRMMLRGALVPGMIALPILAGAFWAYAGERGAISALAGAATVFVVLVVGLLGITAVVMGPAATSMAGAGVVYLGQLVIILAIVLFLSRVNWLDGRSFALSAVAQTIVMQVGQITGYVRARHEIHPGSLDGEATS